MKTREQNKQQMNGNRAIWLVCRTDTNACGVWSVKRTFGWKNFMPENFLEINRYFALTSYCNTIGYSNNAFLWQKMKSPCFELFIYWLIKQITNTNRNHVSRSYENHSNLIFSYFCRYYVPQEWQTPDFLVDYKQSLFSLSLSSCDWGHPLFSSRSTHACVHSTH